MAKKPPKPTLGLPIVGIGASAGGFEALRVFFSNMPDSPEMVFVVVLHLDPTQESFTAELLQRYSKMPVQQAVDQTEVESNHVYLIPPDRDIGISQGILHLTQPTERRGLRRPIDFFLQALAEDLRERAVGVILSGTGSDGTLGIQEIKAHGGMVMVQSPHSAKYEGMPLSAISTGDVDYVLGVEEMPATLVRYGQHPYVRRVGGEDPVDIDDPQALQSILSVLQAQVGHSFRHYKRSTIIRRVSRRMGLKQITDLAEYAAFLRENPEETKDLFQDLLIGVTRFFREPGVWQAIEKLVLQKLDLAPEKRSTLRIWVPGCSTGEEAYSLAILVLDHLMATQQVLDIQIFATDVDKQALDRARTGRYPAGIANDIPAPLLEKYFKQEDEFFTVSSRVRDCVVFSQQNLLGDPPFSRLDLISCRNLLIYLEADIQKKILELFHFALRPGSHLLLGGSESIGQCAHLFETVSKRWRIFRCLQTTQRPLVRFPIASSKRPIEIEPFPSPEGRLVVDAASLVERALLEELAPASVLINRKHEVLYHFGPTVEYLSYPPGAPTNDLYSLARKGLGMRIRGAVHKAIRDQIPVTVEGVRDAEGENAQRVRMRVFPLTRFSGGEGLLLVTFEDRDGPGPEGMGTGESVGSEQILQQLEYELNVTREDLQNTIEELETSNEELKTSNEEVTSMNEELQSSNEELETSKEELQSLNEELITVNQELNEKVSVLEGTNDDLTNLIHGTEVAAIFLDTKLQITFFTPTSQDLFRLIATDIGRPIEDIAPRFEGPALEKDAAAVLRTLTTISRNVLNYQGRWFRRKIMPYRTADHRIVGLVVTFSDIDESEKSRRILEGSEGQLRNLVEASPFAMAWIDGSRLLQAVNQAFCDLIGKARTDLLGQSFLELAFSSGQQSEKLELLSRLFEGDQEKIEVEGEASGPKSRKLHLRWTLIPFAPTQETVLGVMALGSLAPEDQS